MTPRIIAALCSDLISFYSPPAAWWRCWRHLLVSDRGTSCALRHFRRHAAHCCRLVAYAYADWPLTQFSHSEINAIATVNNQRYAVVSIIIKLNVTRAKQENMRSRGRQERLQRRRCKGSNPPPILASLKTSSSGKILSKVQNFG